MSKKQRVREEREGATGVKTETERNEDGRRLTERQREKRERARL